MLRTLTFTMLFCAFGGGALAQRAPAPDPNKPRDGFGWSLELPMETNAETLVSTVVGYPVIIALVPGRPAARAGLRVGDELLSLDGIDLASGRRVVLGPPAGTRVVVKYRQFGVIKETVLVSERLYTPPDSVPPIASPR